MRPIHFIMVVWGEHYRKHYLPMWMDSMLAEGNLPVLDAKDGHSLYIGCPEEDWPLLVGGFPDELFYHVTPKHVLIDPCPPIPPEDIIRLKAVEHQNNQWDPMLKAAYDPNAYGSITCPDCIFSQGYVAFMKKAVEEGIELLSCPALRQAEEPLLDEIKDCNLRTEMVPAKVANLFSRYLHREVQPYVHPVNPNLPDLPFFMYRIEDDTIVLHTFFGVAVLMDFAKIDKSHMDGNLEICFRTPMYENCKNRYYVSDSDEMCIVSLTLKDGKNYPDVAPCIPTDQDDIASLQRAFGRHGVDSIRKGRFYTPYVIHSSPVNQESLAAVERKVSNAIPQWGNVDG